MNVIEIKNLSLSKNGKFILKNLNFELKKHQHLAIIGKNGAGKSFLSRILAADLMPRNGSYIKVLDKEFGKVKLSELRKKIGFVSSFLSLEFNQKVSFIKNYITGLDPDYSNLESQNENLNTSVNSVLEIVLTGFFGNFGLSQKVTQEMKNLAIKKLADVGLNENTKVNLETDFQTLSDGEKRKVLLARSLVSDPEILIFDEPCQGLDIPSRESFLKQIEKLSKQKNIIYTTHHIEELPECITHVLLLNEGEIFKIGTKQEILNSENLSKLFDVELELIQKYSRYSIIIKNQKA